MATITPEEARAYIERWELVREEEDRQLRSTPLAVKFRQLEALMESRHLLGPDPNRAAEVQVVRERWARLRQALSG